ncbi:HesA/MoeB/ThiF family protein [Candidatus Contubernalis alkaliaceticus]|uniref:HesA/MoeB/ThiF family protein n=1 Tax=Candidatus Contubernalis alkaliaceticus TaxID=338645 RepID=UPI001F4C15C0|nr:HesA/MoeB/ThiF family protein [Candidatus Contubernalis alkalaceticus]UNC91013.1 HesA/MoeB/ThiF family protein [Candidatus Contubernalis alkalaceticus]
MEDLAGYLHSRADAGHLPWTVQVEAAQKYSHTLGQVEETALREGLLPFRYLRNGSTISPKQQLRLFQSRVTVVGCGGLGGYVIEELSRLGVGRLTVIDHDIFEEHNLNRQLFSNMETLDRSKVSAAVERIKLINPAVTVKGIEGKFSKIKGPEMILDSQVVADALDGISIRLELAEVCKQLKVPLVHGAIAGWYGQVLTQFPGENSLETLYGKSIVDKGREKELGNLPFTPALVASLQAAEVCKVLLNVGSLLRGRVLYIDLLDMEFEEVPL